MARLAARLADSVADPLPVSVSARQVGVLIQSDQASQERACSLSERRQCFLMCNGMSRAYEHVVSNRCLSLILNDITHGKNGVCE